MSKMRPEFSPYHPDVARPDRQTDVEMFHDQPDMCFMGGTGCPQKKLNRWQEAMRRFASSDCENSVSNGIAWLLETNSITYPLVKKMVVDFLNQLIKLCPNEFFLRGSLVKQYVSSIYHLDSYARPVGEICDQIYIVLLKLFQYDFDSYPTLRDALSAGMSQDIDIRYSGEIDLFDLAKKIYNNPIDEADDEMTWETEKVKIVIKRETIPFAKDRIRWDISFYWTQPQIIKTGFPEITIDLGQLPDCSNVGEDARTGYLATARDKHLIAPLIYEVGAEIRPNQSLFSGSIADYPPHPPNNFGAKPRLATLFKYFRDLAVWPPLNAYRPNSNDYLSLEEIEFAVIDNPELRAQIVSYLIQIFIADPFKYLQYHYTGDLKYLFQISLFDDEQEASLHPNVIEVLNSVKRELKLQEIWEIKEIYIKWKELFGENKHHECWDAVLGALFELFANDPSYDTADRIDNLPGIFPKLFPLMLDVGQSPRRFEFTPANS